MPHDTLTVAEVAEVLGVSPTTARRLADSLAHSLSDGARNRPRAFTVEDVDRLQMAYQLRPAKRQPAIADAIPPFHSAIADAIAAPTASPLLPVLLVACSGV